MACLIKAPSDRSKGVVVFTTQERDHVIQPDPALAERIRALKNRWLVGLHHNWHDYAFRYEPLFDFSMAGEDDLREVEGRRFPTVPLDACDFVPSCFQPSRGERFWDVLYIARAVGFKRIPKFFESMRQIYDAGHGVRVLCVCPVPPYDPKDEGTVFYDLRARYDGLFTDAEQDLFTLLTLDFRYPFPFDLPTLAFLYRSSRVFVHFADEERRCRVAAYAWASGLPVVAPAAVASLLPTPFRKPPIYYEVERDEAFPETILRAIAEADETDPKVQTATRDLFVETATVARLAKELGHLLGVSVGADELAAANLDRRLGRHHGLSSGGNRVEMSVARLVEMLATSEDFVTETINESTDPELRLVEPVITPRPQGGRVARVASRLSGGLRR